MLLRFYFFLTHLVVFVSVHGQSPGPGQAALKIFFFPKNAIIYIDSNKITSCDTTLFLSPGNYQIKAWAPYRDMLDTIMNLTEGTKMAFARVLNFDSKYVSFRNELKEYKRKRFKQVGLVFTGSVILGTGSVIAGNLAQRKFDMALEDKLNYELAYDQSDIDRFKQQYAEHRKQYYVMSGVRYGLGLCSAVILSVSVRNLILYLIDKRYPRPRYYPETLLTGISINPNPGRGSSFSGSVVIKM